MVSRSFSSELLDHLRGVVARPSWSAASAASCMRAMPDIDCSGPSWRKSERRRRSSCSAVMRRSVRRSRSASRSRASSSSASSRPRGRRSRRGRSRACGPSGGTARCALEVAEALAVDGQGTIIRSPPGRASSPPVRPAGGSRCARRRGAPPRRCGRGSRRRRGWRRPRRSSPPATRGRWPGPGARPRPIRGGALGDDQVEREGPKNAVEATSPPAATAASPNARPRAPTSAAPTVQATRMPRALRETQAPTLTPERCD